MRLPPLPRITPRQAMASSSTLRIPGWGRRRSAVPGAAFAPGLGFVRILAAEFKRAAAATHRYEQLKRMARAGDEPATDIARRIYLEFYADG
jgi:hypothetical protein